MRLSHRDFDLLQHAILAIHDLDRIESFQEEVPGLFMEVIPADWFVIMDAEVDVPAKRVTMLKAWEVGPRRLTVDIVNGMESVVFDHPFSRYMVETGDRTSLKFSDFFSLPQLRRTDLYNAFYRHVGVERFLATACLTRSALTTINAGRPARFRDFTERDRLLMDLLRPHYELARQSAERNGARREEPLRSYGLTRRETEVARGLADGRANPEIARMLHMRPRTVEKHVERILNKLGVENRTAAALRISSARPEE